MAEPLVIFLVILCTIVVAGCVAWLTTWGMWRALLDLQYRTEDLEGRVLRETRIRAAGESIKKRQADEDLTEWANAQKPAPATTQTMPAFKDWYRSKMKSTL